MKNFIIFVSIYSALFASTIAAVFFIFGSSIAHAAPSTLGTGNGGTGTTTWITNSVPYFNGSRFVENNSLFNFTGTKLNVSYASTTETDATTICLTGDTCRTTWPSGGSGSNQWATSSVDSTSITPSMPGTGILVNASSSITNFNFINATGTAATSTWLAVTNTASTSALVDSGVRSALMITSAKGAVSAYSGSSGVCTNQFPTSISALGVLGTCTSVTDSFFSGQLGITHGGTNASSFTNGQPISYDGTRLVSTTTLMQITSASTTALGVSGIAYFADGAANAPSITFTSSPTTGIYRDGTNSMTFETSSNVKDVTFSTGTGLKIAGNQFLAWTSSSNDSTAGGDTFLARNAAGKLYVGATGGNADGTLIMGTGGIGTTTPFGKFAISLNNGEAYTGNNAFIIASTTSANATSTLFSVSNTGAVVLTSTGSLGSAANDPLTIGNNSGVNGNLISGLSGVALGTQAFIIDNFGSYVTSGGGVRVGSTGGNSGVDVGYNHNGVTLGASVNVGWSAGAQSAAQDTGFSRLSAAKSALGNGTNGDFSGTLILNGQGVGTSTPFGKFALSLNAADTPVGNNAFIISSSTASATSTLFRVSSAGSVQASSTFFTNSTTTGSTYLSGITLSRPLYVDSTGLVTSAGSGVSGNCIQWGANNTLTDSGSTNCGGGGGGGAWPFTPSSNFGISTQSTSTAIADTAGFMSSSTIQLAGDLNLFTSSGWIKAEGNTLLVGSSTNQSTVVGVAAGGNNATTSATVNGTTAVGYGAGGGLTTATGNTTVGWNTLTLATTSPNNTAIGYGALWGSSASPSSWSATGHNVAVGTFALGSSTTANSNVAIGYLAGRLITTGTASVYIGGSVSSSGAITGANNVMIGSTAGNQLTSGQLDTFVGQNAGQAISSGQKNTGIGASALSGGGTFSQNTAVGYLALTALNPASANSNDTAIGFQMGKDMLLGVDNTLLGQEPNTGGNNLTNGSGNILIGYNPLPRSSTDNLFFNIGNSLFGILPATSSATTLGQATGNSLGISTTTPWAKFSIQANSGDTFGNLFVVASSTSAAGVSTTTALRIDNIGHIYASSTSPTLTSCGTSPVVTGSDSWGEIVPGATAGGCTLTFQHSYSQAPICTVSNQSMSVVNAMTYTISSTALTITMTGIAGDKVDYHCFGTAAN